MARPFRSSPMQIFSYFFYYAKNYIGSRKILWGFAQYFSTNYIIYIIITILNRFVSNMCLIIDSTKHKKLFGFYLPKIAWKDIPVYKELHHSGSGQISTTFRNYSVIFHKNKAVLKSIFTRHGAVIYKGIHAYRKKVIPLWDDQIHKAIIPKGSLYYIGLYGEIVSTKLIIFEND